MQNCNKKKKIKQILVLCKNVGEYDNKYCRNKVLIYAILLYVLIVLTNLFGVICELI